MKKTMQFEVQLNTDCEGPTCLNDNAFELCKAFLTDGKRFFEQLSVYDDILYLNKRKYDFLPDDYATGDTLRLILPFLRANGLTNRMMDFFVAKVKRVKFMKGAVEGHKYLRNQSIPVFEISTSYAPFAYAVAEKIQVEKKNVFCTQIDLDQYFFTREEIRKIKDFQKEVVNLPDIKAPEVSDQGIRIDPSTRKAVKRLNEIFWFEMPKMDCWGLIFQTEVMNGKRKVNAIIESLKRTGLTEDKVVYVGDSITDKEALRFVKRNGGLALSFNGNSYAMEEAEVACIGKNSSVIAALVLSYSQGGRKAVRELVEHWNSKSYLKEMLPERIFLNLFPTKKETVVSCFPRRETILSFITNKNKLALTTKSVLVRKEVRKEAGVLS